MTEELALTKRQLEKQTAKLLERSTGTASSREADLESELKLTMVICQVSNFSCISDRGSLERAEMHGMQRR